MRRILASAFVAAVLVAGTALAVAPAASAAERPVDITNPEVLLGGEPVDPSTPLTTNDQLRFQADWHVAGQVNAGDTFTVPLPSSFEPVQSTPFSLLDETGTPIARCEYQATVIACTFLPDGPYRDPQGDIWFVGTLEETAEGEPGPVWEVGGGAIPLPVPTPATPGVWRPGFGTDKSGTGEIVDGKAVLTWNILMWPGSSPDDAQAVRRFDVSDTLTSTSPNQPHTLVADSFQLTRYQQDPTDPTKGLIETRMDLPLDGSYVAGYPNFLGETFSAPVVDDSGTSFAFSIDDMAFGYQYRLRYTSVATGAVSFETDLFANDALVNGESKDATVTPKAFGGGGADAGAYTSFAVSKRLTNNSDADLPDTYELTVTSGAISETIAVPADGTLVNSGYYAADAPIVLCEKVPDVDDITWKPYTITGAGVTGPDANGCFTLRGIGGQRVEIVLTNVADAVTPSPSPSTPVTPSPSVTPTPAPTPTPTVTPTTTPTPTVTPTTTPEPTVTPTTTPEPTVTPTTTPEPTVTPEPTPTPTPTTTPEPTVTPTVTPEPSATPTATPEPTTTPDPSAPATTPAAPATSSAPTSPAPRGTSLPTTGSDGGALGGGALAAVLLAVIGAALVIARRRSSVH